MNTSYIFETPTGGLTGLTDFTNRWQAVLDSHSAGKHRETILNLLDYLDPEAAAKYGSADGNEFNLPHGSIIINMRITDSALQIRAPFLSLPEKRVNALLRQVSEINFGVLFLTQIVLREDQLHFEIDVPLSLCEPYKLYDILYELCINADHFDDVFIEKFQAKRICEPKCIHCTDAELADIYARFGTHVKEGLDYLHYFRDNRWYDMGVESGLISLWKIDYIFSPKGFLAAEIGKVVNDSFSKAAPAEKLDNLCGFFSDLAAITPEKFSESIYRTESLISLRKHAFLPLIKKELENYYLNAEKDISSSAFMSAVVFLLYDVYNLLYRFLVPRSIEETLNHGLHAASGKDWKTAAEELFKAVSEVMKLQQPSE